MLGIQIMYVGNCASVRLWNSRYRGERIWLHFLVVRNSVHLWSSFLVREQLRFYSKDPVIAFCEYIPGRKYITFFESKVNKRNFYFEGVPDGNGNLTSVFDQLFWLYPENLFF